MQQISKYYQNDKDGGLNVATEALVDLKDAEDTYISVNPGAVDRFRTRDGRPSKKKEFTGAGKVLGKGFTDELIDNGKVNLTGIKLRSAKDLATLAQVYRDPRFETFRIFFVRGNQIVGQQAVSSRLPSSSKVFAEKDNTTFLQSRLKDVDHILPVCTKC